MRNLKKFLALVLAMMMAMSLMVTANAKNPNYDYPDIKDATFTEAIDVLTGMGVFRGDNGNFKPTANIMRSEAVAVLYRLVTGDVKDEKVDLYAPLATYFNDVKADDWFAPYVGFAVDAGYVKGYNGNFNPYANVTGYEMLAMLLRAAGYGKNGEFTGSQWQINVGSTAQSLGVLKDIKSTHYNNTLSQPSAREVVADLTFRVAVDVNTVRYEYGYYNQYVGVAMAPYGSNNVKNLTLGMKVFGLWSRTGIVVGNEATGEDATLVGLGGSVEGNEEVVTDKWGYPVKCYTYTDGDDKAHTEFVYRFESDALNPLYDEEEVIITIADGSVAEAEAEDGSTETCDIVTYISGNAGGSLDGYVYSTGVPFDYTTTLDEFAHEATIWYDVNSWDGDMYHTYAFIDKVKSDEAFFADDNTHVGQYKDGDVVKSGVTNSNKAVRWSDRYSQIGNLAPGAQSNLSPISTYRKVTNPSGVVYIALSAEVANVAQVNSTAKAPYLILGSDTPNASTFMNDNKAIPGAIFLANLTTDTKAEQKKAGALVTAYEVVGTSMTLAQANALDTGDEHDPSEDNHRTATTTNHIEDVMYKLAPMTTKTVTVASLKYTTDPAKIDGVDDPVIIVNTTAGDELKLSGITLGDRTEAGATSEIISQALPIVVKEAKTVEGDVQKNIQVKAGVTYTAYTDIVGRFISLVPANDYKFIYGTYADYAIGGLGTGTIAYNLVGVDWDAKTQAENTLESLTLKDATDAEGNPIKLITGINDIDGEVTDIDGKVYDTITATKKDQGQSANGNEIQDGYDTGYMFNATTGDLAEWEGKKMVDGDDPWEITARDAKNGFKKVEADGLEYLLTNKTRFIIVDGTGTATLKVRVANGLAELLGNATDAIIAYDSTDTAASWNEVVFRTDAEKYGTMYTDDNGVVTDVILSEDNLILWSVENLYFDYNQLKGGNGTVLPGTDPDEVQQFDLWQGDKKVSVFIDITMGDVMTGEMTVPESELGLYATADALKAAVTAEELNQAPLFFTLAKAYEKNGVDIYMAFKAPANIAADDGKGNLTGAGFSARETTYDYVTVTNLHTGLFGKDDDQLVLSMDNVTVVDVEFKTTDNAKNTLGRNEITSVQELNNAVSVGKKAFKEGKLDAEYTIDVAVVYDTSNSSAVTVYVLHVKTNAAD